VGLSGRVKSLGGEMCQNLTAPSAERSTSNTNLQSGKASGMIARSSNLARMKSGRATLTMCLSILILASGVCFTRVARADRINMESIAWIESNNTAYAYNSKTQATGVFQITPICLEEWNIFHPSDQYGMDALFDRFTNMKIAMWYLEMRIPQMLKYYDKPITIDNILWAYNAGIGNVVKGRMPKETKNYIKKYHKLEEVLK
jgi:hypothetical protein